MGAPNDIVNECYHEINNLLDKGDEAFAEKGPEVLQKHTQRDGFFENVETVEPEEGDYTRTLIMGGGIPDEMAMIFMEWPEGMHLQPHEHNGRPCFEELIEGELEVTEMKANELEEGRYELENTENYVIGPRETAVVTPPYEIHSVKVREPSKSIHVYPKSYRSCEVYDENSDGTYTRNLHDLAVDQRLHL